MSNVQKLLKEKSPSDIASLALEDRSIIQELVNVLDSRDNFTRSKAASVLAQIALFGAAGTGTAREGARLVAPAIPRLIKLLDDPYESARSEAALALSLIAVGEEDIELVEPAVSNLTKLLDDPHEYAHSNAATALGWIGRAKPQLVEPLIPKLVELLDDPCEYARSSAVRALQGIGLKEAQLMRSAMPKLIKFLDSPHEDVRSDVAFALGQIAEGELELVKPAIPRLIRLLVDPAGIVRSAAASALMGIAEKEPRLVEPAIPNLVDLLDCSSEIEEAADALETIAKKEPQLVKPAIPKLLKLLEHPDDNVRLAALDGYLRLYALGVLGDTGEAEALEPLIRLTQDTIRRLVDPDEYVRSQAGDALVRIVEEEPRLVESAIPNLVDLFLDPDEDVRSEAVYALMSIGEKEPRLVESAIPNLVDLMTCSSEWDDIAVADALETIAKKEPQLVKPAIPKLIKLMEDPDEGGRLRALYEYISLHALGLLGDISEAEVLEPLARLTQDTSKVEVLRRDWKELLEKGELKSPISANYVSTTVGEAAKEAINKIKMANRKRFSQ